MANMCSNIVKFSGENAQDAINFFIAKNNKYDFDIDEEGLEMRFESRWSPMLDDLMYIFKRLKVDVVYYYEELGSGLYGETILKDGKSKTFKMTARDLWEITETDNGFTYRGKEYGSRYDIMDMIIEERKKAYYKND